MSSTSSTAVVRNPVHLLQRRETGPGRPRPDANGRPGASRTRRPGDPGEAASAGGRIEPAQSAIDSAATPLV